MKEPLVTVLMPVYNSGHYLKDAIQSILHQSYKNIEFLIINDGSVDNSVQILSSFHDERIRIINNDGNKGLVYSLNLGLKEAKGDYIARMDADDISMKERVRKQINFLTRRPEIGVCGTAAKTFGYGTAGIWKYPVTHEECMVHLLFHTCFCHPSVVFRKSVIEKYDISYKPEFFPAEDFELWTTYSDKVIYANLPDVLYKYRVHDAQVSLSRLEKQNEVKFEIQLRSLKRILPLVTEEERMLFKKIAFSQFEYNMDFLKKCETLFTKLLKGNEETKAVDENALQEEIQQTWFGICTDFSSHKLYTRKIFRESPLTKKIDFNRNHFKFLVKNFLLSKKAVA